MQCRYQHNIVSLFEASTCAFVHTSFWTTHICRFTGEFIQPTHICLFNTIYYVIFQRTPCKIKKVSESNHVWSFICSKKRKKNISRKSIICGFTLVSFGMLYFHHVQVYLHHKRHIGFSSITYRR